MGNGAVEMNPVLLRALRRALPDTRVTFVDLPLSDTESAVVEGRVDVGILRSPIGSPALRLVALFWQPRVVACASDGPFGQMWSLTVVDLADATFTGVSRRNSPAFCDFFLLRAERNGEPPAHALPAYTLTESGYNILTAGAIATQTAEVLRVLQLPGASLVPLVDAPPSASVAVCRLNDTRSASRAFMDVAAHVAVTAQALVPGVLPLHVGV